MQSKRNRLSIDLMGIQTPKKQIQRLEFHRIIAQQQQVIKMLRKQINHLRQYLFYIADYDEVSQVNTPQKIDNNESNCPSNHLPSDLSNIQSTQNTGFMSRKIIGLKGLIQHIMTVLEANNPEDIICRLKAMKQKANRKIEPIFIEKIKEKKVPMTVQVIKEIEKPIIIEKIVYQDKTIQQASVTQEEQYDDNWLELRGSEKKTKVYQLKNKNQKPKYRQKIENCQGSEQDAHHRKQERPWRKKKYTQKRYY